MTVVEPGPVIALLEEPRVTVELIADSVHVDPAIFRHSTSVNRSSSRRFRANSVVRSEESALGEVRTTRSMHY